MFNKFDQLNLNNGVDADRVKMLKYMLKLGIEWFVVTSQFKGNFSTISIVFGSTWSTKDKITKSKCSRRKMNMKFRKHVQN